MPLIIVIGILAAVGVSGAINKPKRTPPSARNSTERMLREMTGKSKVEKRAILRKYR